MRNTSQTAAFVEVSALLYVERQESTAKTQEMRELFRKEFAYPWLFASVSRDIGHLPLFLHETDPGNWIAKNLRVEYLAGTGALRLSLRGGSPAEQKIILHSLVHTWLNFFTITNKIAEDELIALRKDRRRCQ